MDATEIDSVTTLEIDPIERWNVFKRLQELSIPCQCTWGQPLRVRIKTATAAIQVWSVIQQFTSTSASSTAHLERCWRKPAKR
ncbi:Asr1405/Asl0597 family protein [Sphaerothrix gracilis]|uniref:Asr1405/Asl0597 family protein n=1 Tax=Sphaerothrix gracilis TaxID=3151835 RepID=UPI0031FDBE46